MQRMFTTFAALVAALLAIGAGALQAQSPEAERNERVNTTERILAERNQQEDLTAQLSAWLILDNHAQVQLGQMAIDKSQRPEVREFAQTMIDDHSRTMKVLQKFVGDQDVGQRNDTGTEAEAREIAAQHHGQMQQIGQTVAKFKLHLTEKLLDQYEGQDFDMGYLGQQLVAHVEMLATLEAMKDHGSPEFQQVVAGAIESTKEHFQQNRQLAQKFEDDRKVQNREDGVNRFNDAARPAPTEERPAPPEGDLRLENRTPAFDSDIKLRPSIKENQPLDLEAEGDVQP